MVKEYYRLINVNFELEDIPKFLNENKEIKTKNYPINYTSSTKYSWYDFFPKCTYYFLSKIANAYYLFMLILISIPGISPYKSISTLLTFLTIYFFTILREWIENINKWLNDRKENSKICTIIKDNEYYDIKWSELKVGDMVFIKNNETIPADIVQLSSNFDSGISFIETSSLDGEKNLKIRQSIKETLILSNNTPIINDKFLLSIDPPNCNLHYFNGQIYFLKNDKINNNWSSINLDNFLYKGSKLKNVKWILGIVIFTGADTKIMKNIDIPKIKTSEMEKKANKYIFFIFFVILVFSLTIFIIKFIKKISLFEKNILNLSYYEAVNECSLNYLIILGHMISMSYTISVEMAKIFIGFFYNCSLELKSNKINYFTKIRSYQIIDELSKIDFILSDKTGTITMNCLEFEGCQIGNQLYGGKLLQNIEEYYEFIKNNKPKLGLIDFTFYDEDLNLLLLNINQILFKKSLFFKDQLDNIIFEIKSQNHLSTEFFKCLAIANECVINNDQEEIKYEASSPDDITLCNAAKFNGVILEGSCSGYIKINMNNKSIKIKKLEQFNFESSRKCMSIIIEEDNLVKLYIKGADTKFINNLSNINNKTSIIRNLKEKIHIFSKMGKRIICIGLRIMTKKEWKYLETEYKSILSNYRELELEEKIKDFLNNKLEINLTLIGFSILNDKLQKNVKYTIKKIFNANIKFWMITGDNLETAKFISKSAGIIGNNFEIIMLNKNEDIHNLKIKIEDINKNLNKITIIIDMSTINNLQLIQNNIDLLIKADSVVCARSSPKNKGLLVKWIKNKNLTVLGIGDGANDINLIQESDIGIGILGVEGNHASNVSDISIGEFQVLWKLIFLYGRWTYIRISNVIIYTFYKNFLISILSLLYGFYDGLSGISIFSGWLVNFYNLFINAYPLAILTLVDKDIDYRKLNKKKNKNHNILIRLFKPWINLFNFDILTRNFIKDNIEKLYFEFKNDKYFNKHLFISIIFTY